MKISSSIVLYNNEPEKIHFVLKCLAESSLDIQASVIDNSRKPILLDLSCVPKADYIKTSKNIGFGTAHNLAIKKSLESGTKYHLVLNPDIYFPSQAIEDLYNYMEAHPDVGNIMPLVCYPDGENQYLAKLLPTPGTLAVRLFHHMLPSRLVEKVNRKYEIQDLPLDRPVQVPALSGCFMFLRCEALRRVGLFDERFFLYFEDYDLIRRINSKYKVIYYPEVSIIHHFERASRKNPVAFFHHILSAVKYFNKWGWVRDEQRKVRNQKVLCEIALNSPKGPK
jgi:GT2 family glycosyltransferase